MRKGGWWVGMGKVIGYNSMADWRIEIFFSFGSRIVGMYWKVIENELQSTIQNRVRRKHHEEAINKKATD